MPADAGGAPRAARCGGGVRLSGTRIELEPGVRLDLGGIGKGYAADRAAELLALAGPCLVNAGGDVAIRGGSWPVGVDGAVTLELSDGALATSGRDRRRWRRAGRELHHLIDPATGLPAETDLLRVTAVGSDAVEAEVLAKWLFLAGEAEAARERHSLRARDRGRTRAPRRWPRMRGPDLLDPRAGERADRVRAAHGEHARRDSSSSRGRSAAR